MLAASWRNLLQWLWAKRHPRFIASIARIFHLVRQRTMEKLFIVTGSCGVQFLAAALNGEAASGCAIDLLAMGPVGDVPDRSKLGRLHVVQGKADYWSRALWRGPVDCRTRAGHLDYYRDPAVRASARHFFSDGFG